MGNEGSGTKPVWLLIEEQIVGLGDVSGGEEASVQKIAKALDEQGLNASNTAGHMIDIRAAVEQRIKTGRAPLKDINDAIAALKLEDVGDAYRAGMNIIEKVGASCPHMMKFARRAAVLKMVDATKLDLQIKRANELGGDKGIRFLLECKIPEATILESLGIDQTKLDGVKAVIAAELAEIARVKELLEKVKDKSDEDKIKHLINSNVTDGLIGEVGGFGADTIAGAKKAMEEEIREKERLAAEEAERKRKEAEGPSLDELSNDQMLSYIEEIRDIFGFTEEPAEVRQMCEQSGIPKALIEIAVSDKAKLDEMEAKAEAG